ncbi:lipoprotein [Sodalis glossinidius str. 'morsitans']|uniref:Lipoprotein n=1 Tax=Sodalis glossinidius (strain morsitans) TaxID=343509 RepID=Q2NUW7_SODGM|nr:lipoprotein YedD [Sodalis glossinidius]BAE74058.1 conserved hypothetical protein [Sodalis glossinidius str. 'morsitans']CRL44627.1 lipoprotein [Sodalis glossinidius str. 'morsitans']
MKRTPVMILLAAALSGCAGAPEYVKVVAAPAPQGYSGIWTSTSPQKALVSPEAVASLIISRSGNTLDCRSWQRTIIRPGKLTTRDARLYNINEKNEVSALRLDHDVLHYGGLTLQRSTSPTEQCQPFIAGQGDNWVFSAAEPTAKAPGTGTRKKAGVVR